MSSRNIHRATRLAVGLAAAVTPLVVASSGVFASDSTTDGYTHTLQSICKGQGGIVGDDSPGRVSCENVTPSPYRSYVLDVADHVCTELLDSTFSSGQAFGASDGSIITWTCS
jgi:hypothetical protein